MSADGPTPAPRTPSRKTLAAAIVGLVVGIPAGYMAGGIHRPAPPPPPLASAPGADHAAMGHRMDGGTDGTGTPAQRAFRDAAARMHADMGVPSSGDVDLDFARGMVPHHQGAVDMAEVELRHGTDPEMRSLATKVVRTQREEVRQMREWIARRERR